MRGFEVEQEALPGEASAEPHQLTRSADHAVTGHNDGDRVAPVGGTNRAHGTRRSHFARQLAIATRLTVRNAAQQAPHALLEARTDQFEGQIENMKLTGEIQTKLSQRLKHQSRCAILDAAPAEFDMPYTERA